MPFHDESIVMPEPGESYNIRQAAVIAGISYRMLYHWFENVYRHPLPHKNQHP